ncbi:MAG: hypothetical protein KJZ86_13035 [Caldilineaceae bacterium]|nr:hypothetical protein [Caldilineaceae bacterium]
MDEALIRKLYISSEQRALILNPPTGFLARLQPDPKAANLHISCTRGNTPIINENQNADCADFRRLNPCESVLSVSIRVLFSEQERRFRRGRRLHRFLSASIRVSSGVQTDLTRDAGWAAIYNLGYGGVASISIDDTWSGVRFRPQPGAQAWLADQYAGKKAGLRPIYDKLAAFVGGFWCVALSR